MSSVTILNAVHSFVGGQTAVRATVDHDGAAIPKGTVHVAFYKYFAQPRTVSEGKEPEPNLGPVPAWVKSKYPGYVTYDEATQYLSAVNDFKQSTVYKQAQNHAATIQSLHDALETLPDGFIIPRRVADEYANCPVPTGTSTFFFSRVFPGSIEPWDFIRISVLDGAGAEVAHSVWYPS